MNNERSKRIPSLAIRAASHNPPDNRREAHQHIIEPITPTIERREKSETDEGVIKKSLQAGARPVGSRDNLMFASPNAKNSQHNNLAPPDGLEPPTRWLTASCSTD